MAVPFRAGTSRTRTPPAPTWATPVLPPLICHLAALGGRYDSVLRGVASVPKHLGMTALGLALRERWMSPDLFLSVIGSFLLSGGLGGVSAELLQVVREVGSQKHGT